MPYSMAGIHGLKRFPIRKPRGREYAEVDAARLAIEADDAKGETRQEYEQWGDAS